MVKVIDNGKSIMVHSNIVVFAYTIAKSYIGSINTGYYRKYLINY